MITWIRSLWRLTSREGSRISKRLMNELSRFSRHADRNGIQMDISQGAIFAHVAEESHQAAADSTRGTRNHPKFAPGPRPVAAKMWWCAGMNRHGVEDERTSQERSSDPRDPEFCDGTENISRFAPFVLVYRARAILDNPWPQHAPARESRPGTAA